MSVENGKVCCNCRHCKRIPKEHGTVIECRCDRDNAYLTYATVLGHWCRHWAKEIEGVIMTNKEAIEILTQTQIYWGRRSGKNAFTEALLKAIEALKNEDTKRKTGKWLYCENKLSNNYDWFICSCCGNKELTNQDNYCRNCGAQMLRHKLEVD